VETDPAEILERASALFRQDVCERALFGASVVDAYMDLEKQYRFVARRLPHLPKMRVRRLAYAVLDRAIRGGLSAYV